MIERDRRDDVEHGTLDDVGRIEPAAEADLEQQHVGRVLGEGEKRRRSRDLELGDVVAAVGRLRARQHVDQRLLADRAPPCRSAPASSMRSWKRTRCGEV